MNHAPSLSAHRWLELQTELRDLAFILDRKGNPAAADVASSIAVRIGELVSEETRADSSAKTLASEAFLS